MAREKGEGRFTITPTKGGFQIGIQWWAAVVFICGMLTTSTLGGKVINYLFPQLDTGSKDRQELKVKVSDLEKQVADLNAKYEACMTAYEFIMHNHVIDRNTPNAPDWTIRVKPKGAKGSMPPASATPETGVTTPGNRDLR